jgi:crotonobetainyl-CoA:carnitine CoA-transferase CaiB-like acyl-CoA transferase
MRWRCRRTLLGFAPHRIHRRTATLPQHSLPLSDLRVIDLSDGAAGVTGRFLAEMGADVTLVEPPGGVASRYVQPIVDGHSLRFASTHFNKRGVVLDLTSPEGRAGLLELIDDADLVVESQLVGHLAALGIGHEAMRERNPQLVVVSVTEFGQFGPFVDWKASESVLVAMSSAMTRSGAPEREPLTPPGELALQTAAFHAAFAALLAVHNAKRTGVGDYVDCSLFDLVVQDFDPPFGIGGTATMGQPLTDLPPGRPDRRMLYPILPCADGHVRMFVASAKQWRSLHAWMGEPEEFSDPSFEQLFTRFMNWDKIRPALVRLFADQTRDDIVSKASELGIAVAPLNTSTEVLQSDHVKERESFVRSEVAPGLFGQIANGCIAFDGQRAGFRTRAPQLGEHDETVASRPSQAEPRSSATVSARPLKGLRVLDLGVIVVGAETGRSLADQGAEVIKVENRTFMDGARQSDSVGRCGYSFALGNRGKRSFGLNLRSDAGKEVFLRLVKKSDVILTNFKPGTLETLGLDFPVLRGANPRIILVESSALGSSGPWSQRMGYGPLVRATAGLTQLWRHPDAEDAFGDDMTVYPDHAAGRVGAAAVTAALIGRERSGRGCHIELAQMETVFSQMAPEFLRESLEPGTLVARGNIGEFDAPTGVYRCAGEDAYCAVTVGDDEAFAGLIDAIGRPDLASHADYATADQRVAHRAELDELLSNWLAPLTPVEAQERLQRAGVPAGAAVHAYELLDNPHLAARQQFGQLRQPGFDEPLDTFVGPALFANIAEPELLPAPLMAADTRAICRDILHMTDDDIDRLVADGVLEVR